MSRGKIKACPCCHSEVEEEPGNYEVKARCRACGWIGDFHNCESYDLNYEPYCSPEMKEALNVTQED